MEGKWELGKRLKPGVHVPGFISGVDINSVHLTWLTEALMPKPAILSASATQKMGFQREA